MTRADGASLDGARHASRGRRLCRPGTGSLWRVGAQDRGGMGRLLTVLAIAGVAAPVALLLSTGNTAASTAGHASIRTLFLSDCAVCHGADARGTSNGPSLVESGAAGVDFWVSTGRMPLASPDATPTRHPPRYSPQRIRALVAYVTRLTRHPSPPIPTVHVGEADLA